MRCVVPRLPRLGTAHLISTGHVVAPGLAFLTDLLDHWEHPRFAVRITVRWDRFLFFLQFVWRWKSQRRFG